jgi:hypothetical protein
MTQTQTRFTHSLDSSMTHTAATLFYTASVAAKEPESESESESESEPESELHHGVGSTATLGHTDGLSESESLLGTLTGGYRTANLDFTSTTSPCVNDAEGEEE